MLDRSELMKAIQSFMEESEGPSEAVLGADENVQMTRSADARVHIETSEAESGNARAATLFKGTEERPAGFPGDLPFLAGQRSLVFVDESTRLAMWTEAGTESADELLAQSLTAGWTRVDEVLEAPDQPAGIRLVRDDDERVILSEVIGVQVVDRLGAGTGR